MSEVETAGIIAAHCIIAWLWYDLVKDFLRVPYFYQWQWVVTGLTIPTVIVGLYDYAILSGALQ